MIITKSIAERYAKRLIENYQAKLPIKGILLEITKKYNRFFCEANNFSPEQADAFVKKEEPKFYKALRDNQNMLITSPTIGGNYGPYIKGIVNLILQFIANNLPENPDEFVHVGQFDLGNELDVEVEKQNTTVGNVAPSSEPQASGVAAESYNRGLSFKNYLENDELNKHIKHSILRKVFTENNLPDELLNEILGGLYSGVKSMLGGKKIPRRVAATHDQKITAAFGSKEEIDRKLKSIFSSLIQGLMRDKGSLQKFGKPMNMILPQIVQGLKKEFSKSQQDSFAYMKKLAPEKSFVKSTDTRKSFIGSLFGYKSQAEQAALALAKQNHNKFVSFMEMMGIDPNNINQMTVDEFKKAVKQGSRNLDNQRRQTFYTFMSNYKKQLEEVFKKIEPEKKLESNKQVETITKASNNEKVDTVLSKLGAGFKKFGLSILAILILGLAFFGSEAKKNTNLDNDNRAKAAHVEKKVGGDGGGPDTTGQSGQLQKHLDGLADQLEKLSSGFQKEMTEPGNILKNLIDKAYGAGHTSPEELAQLLEQNPNLAQFLDGLNFKSLEDVNKAIEKADSLGLNFNQLKSLTQKLHDIANKPAQDAKPATGAFGDYSKARDAGDTPDQASKTAAAPQIAKRGILGTIGQGLFGATDVNTKEKVKPGFFGRLLGKPKPAVEPVKVEPPKKRGFFGFGRGR